MSLLSARSPLARLTVAGACAVAGLVTVAAPALADDTTSSDVDGSEESTPTSTPETSAAPDDESDVEESTSPETGTSTSEATSTEDTPDPKVVDDVDEAEEVVPNYGSRKFRVGVRLAEDNDLPAGTVTEGSVLRVTVTSQDGADSETFDCTTIAVGDPGSGDSQCEGNLFRPYPNQPELRASARGVDIDDPGQSATDRLNWYYTTPGATVTVQHLSSPGELAPETRTATVTPCEVSETDALFCDDTADVWFELGAPSPEEPAEPTDPSGPTDPSNPADPSDTSDSSDAAGSARLPDTGGPEGALLALGLGMVAAGGTAVAAGRRRSDA
ncbi:hypothetical protein GCM10008944_23340 [Cytobacillus oceanisediminis]